MKITDILKPLLLSCASLLTTSTSLQAAPSVEDSIVGLYVAYYNRAPDQGGVDFWMDQAARNGNASALLSISEGFSNHPQFMEDYPATDTTEQFVTKIYNNILNRSPDAGGLAYWVEQINGGLPKTEFIVTYINLVLDYNEDDPEGIKSKQLVTNKVMVGKYFKDTLGTDSEGEPGSQAYTRSIEVLSQVTENISTVETAKSQISDYSSGSSIPTKK